MAHPIELHWAHGKKATVEPQRKLTAAELITRVHEYHGRAQLPVLSQEVS